MDYSICKKCGRKVAIDVNFCSGCGEKIDHSEVVNAINEEKITLVNNVKNSEETFAKMNELLNKSIKYKKVKPFFALFKGKGLIGGLINLIFNYLLLGLYAVVPYSIANSLVGNKTIIDGYGTADILTLIIWGIMIGVCIKFRMKSKACIKEFEKLTESPEIQWLGINYRNPYSYYIIKEGVESGRIRNMREAIETVETERFRDEMREGV